MDRLGAVGSPGWEGETLMVTRALLPAILVLGLVAAACGPDRTPDDVAVAGDTTSTTAAQPTDDPSTTEGDDGSDGDDGSGAETPETTEPAPDVAMFGDLEMPCRPGDTSGYEASDQGVTADTITIGTGDDRGFPSTPGLNVEMGDAVRAMVAWCNELGGINGRQIELNYYDAAILEVNNRMLESCASDFMLVGQGFALDGTGEQTRVECGLYSVPGFSVSIEFAHGPRMIQPVPNPGDEFGVGQIEYASTVYPDELQNTAIMYGNFEATTVTRDKVLAATADPGIDLGDPFLLEYNIQGEDDWTPFVLQLQRQGIEHLYFTGTCVPNLIGFMETAQVQGFAPVLTLESNFYVDVCAESNTSGALDGALVRIVFFPFEEADEFPAVEQYVGIMDDFGGKKSQLGMQGASAFLLWATGADRCGADLTRECVFEEITAIEEWTGGGLHVPSYPAGNRNPGCEITMRITGTAYERVFPEEPGTYDCEDNVGAVGGELVAAAQLDENRVSTVYGS